MGCLLWRVPFAKAPTFTEPVAATAARSVMGKEWVAKCPSVETQCRLDTSHAYGAVSDRRAYWPVLRWLKGLSRETTPPGTCSDVVFLTSQKRVMRTRGLCNSFKLCTRDFGYANLNCFHLSGKIWDQFWVFLCFNIVFNYVIMVWEKSSIKYHDLCNSWLCCALDTSMPPLDKLNYMLMCLFIWFCQLALTVN